MNPLHQSIPDAERKLVYTCLIPIRWGDQDAYGHVNNTLYFRFMEKARCEWLTELDHEIVPVGHSPVIINAGATFLQPLNYPGTVEVKMFAGQIGRSSFPTDYELRLVGDDTLYATGSAKVVWMDHETGKSVAVPDNVREALAG